jgi:hypothetical protein
MALDLLQVQCSDVLYDLGCGDARLLALACKRLSTATTAAISGTTTGTTGATSDSTLKCVGVEYDQAVYMRAQVLVNASVAAGDVCEGQIRLLHDNVRICVCLSLSVCISFSLSTNPSPLSCTHTLTNTHRC